MNDDEGSGLSTLLTGVVIGAAGLAFWMWIF